MTCPTGSSTYEYDKESVDLNLQTISQDDRLHNASQLMRPSSGITIDQAITFKLKLTPSERKSNVYVSLVATNAQSVEISVENSNINTTQVHLSTLIG